MKGVSYLVNDEGKKTHVVLDLEVWSDVWGQVFGDDEAVLLSRNVDDLQTELSELEQVPQPDLDAWLAAFNGIDFRKADKCCS